MDFKQRGERKKTDELTLLAFLQELSAWCFSFVFFDNLYISYMHIKNIIYPDISYTYQNIIYIYEG